MATGRTRLRRALRVLAIGTGSLAIIALLALLLVHTPPGREAVRAALESWGSGAVGGTLRIGRLDLALWRGEAVAAAVSLTRPGLSVDVERASLDWSPTRQARVTLVRPRIVVRRSGVAGPPRPDAEGLAAQPWQVVEKLDRVRVEEGRLEIQDPDGAPWLVLGRFDLESAGVSRGLALRVADASCGWPGAGLRVRGIAVEADVRLEQGVLALERARVTTRTRTIDVRGRLTRIEPISAVASARADVDGALIEELAPGSGLEGPLQAAAAVDVVNDRVTGTLDTSSPALAVAGVGPWSAAGHARFEGRRLIVETFAADGFGGRIEASGPLALGGEPRTEIDARVHGLDAAALVRALGGGVEIPVSARASGTLAWKTRGWDIASSRGDGRLALAPGAGPGLRTSGEAVVKLRGLEVAIDDARLESRGAVATARARIGREGTIEGRWTAELPLASAPAILADLGSSARPPDLSGRLFVEGDLAGPVGAPQGAATVRGEGLAVGGEPLRLAGNLRYDAGRLWLAPLVLGSGGGQATLTGGAPFTPAGEWDVAGAIEALETRPLQRLLGVPGHGAATGSLRVTGRRDDPQGRLALRATASLPRPGGDPQAADGVAVDLEAQSAGRRVHVSRLAMDVAGGRVSGQGRYDASSGALDATVEVERLAWDRLPLLAAPARRLRGTVAGRVALAGTVDAPSGDARLALADATIDDVALPPLSLGARAEAGALRIEGAAGEVFLRGHGSLAGDGPVELEVDVARLPLQAVADALAPRSLRPLTLTAGGTLALSVPLRDPSRVRYTGTGVSASGRVRRVEWRLAPLALAGDRTSVELERLELSAGKASLTAAGRLALDDASAFSLAVDADLDLADLDPGLARRAFSGTSRLRLAVAGTRRAPELSGTLTLADVRGRFEEALLRDLDLEGRFVGRDLEVDRLTAELLGGTATAQGRLPLVPAEGGEPARCTFALQDLDLAQLLGERGEGAEAPALLVSLEGDVAARALALDGLAAQARVTRLETRSVEGGLALEAPASVTLESGRLAVAPLRLTGTLGELEARAEADLGRGAARGSAALVGDLDLRALSPYLPGTTLAGSARVDARLLRSDGSWRLDGGVRVERARLSLDALNFALGDVTGALRFAGDRVEIDASGAAGDGTLRATGDLRLGPSLLGAADVTLEAERVPVAYPAGFRGRASGSVHLTGEPGHYRLAGTVTMGQGYYTAEIDSKSQSLDRLEWQLAALEGGSLTDHVALEVGVQLVEPLRVRNSTLRLDVEGGVAASGTIAQPTATGQVTLREGGELTLGRARVRVQRGTVELNGYPAGTPAVDFQGVTRVSGVLLEVRARGPMDDLQLTLSSDRTDLSQTDLVTLLLTGRTASAAASESGAVVAEQLAVALGGVLQKGVGSALLIDVSPDRSLLTDDTDPTQRFHIGTRITQNATVIYSAALDGTEQQWIVEFNPGGGRFRLRAISEEDNSLSFEVSDRLSFDLWSRGRARPPREVDRLDELRFEGEPDLPPGTLRKAAKLKRHRRYSGLQREQAADRVRARLVEAGYRSASVDSVTERGEGGVTFLMRIEAGPLVPIEWAGDDPGAGARKAALAAWPPLATPELAASVAARAALVRLQADKYYAATVTPEVTPGEGRVAVRFRVVRGPRGSGVDLAFEGNQALDAAALQKGLPRPGSREFFEALDPRSARIGNDVRLAYARVGYLRARAGAPRTAFDAATGRLRVTIPVRERGASVVDAVTLPSEAAGAPDLRLKLAAGQPFDLTAYVADRDALAAWYVANGWIEAQVRGVVEPRGAGVSVRYLADAGPRPRVADIRVAEAGKTRDVLIRRSLSVERGDYVRPTALADSRERLTDIGVFRSVDVRTEPRPDDPERRDVVVGLVDKPDLQVEYGLRYTTQGEGSAGEAPSSPESATLQLAGAVELVNPFGFGVKTRAYAFGTTERQTVGVHLDAATLAGWRVRTQLFLFDDNDDDIELSGVASRVKGLSAQQTRVLLRERRNRRWQDRLRLQWGYTFKDIEYVESVEGSRLIQGDRGFASLALIGDRRDNLTDPRRGLFYTGTTELARTWLGSDVDYVRLYGQIFAYLPVGPVVWAQGYRAGTVPGTDPLLLIENRFHAGGPTTVRGFEQNELGPQTAAGDSLGGQAVVVLNQELRFPLFGKLKGGVFWDAGNVWQTSGELDPFDLRQSVGAGLRYTFPFGPVRLEYAWILRRREGEPTGRFVFGLGHAF